MEKPHLTPEAEDRLLRQFLPSAPAEELDAGGLLRLQMAVRHASIAGRQPVPVKPILSPLAWGVIASAFVCLLALGYFFPQSAAEAGKDVISYPLLQALLPGCAAAALLFWADRWVVRWRLGQ